MMYLFISRGPFTTRMDGGHSPDYLAGSAAVHTGPGSAGGILPPCAQHPAGPIAAVARRTCDPTGY
jgi:hypothetical protein